jgi:hypothetical protein
MKAGALASYQRQHAHTTVEQKVFATPATETKTYQQKHKQA